jgi:hypothetical protein
MPDARIPVKPLVPKALYVTVFKQLDYFDTQNGIGIRLEGPIFGAPLMPQKTLAAAAAF